MSATPDTHKKDEHAPAAAGHGADDHKAPEAGHTAEAGHGHAEHHEEGGIMKSIGSILRSVRKGIGFALKGLGNLIQIPGELIKGAGSLIQIPGGIVKGVGEWFDVEAAPAAAHAHA